MGDMIRKNLLVERIEKENEIQKKKDLSESYRNYFFIWSLIVINEI